MIRFYSPTCESCYRKNVVASVNRWANDNGMDFALANTQKNPKNKERLQDITGEHTEIIYNTETEKFIPLKSKEVKPGVNPRHPRGYTEYNLQYTPEELNAGLL